MSGAILLDTGPLVAYVNRQDDYHIYRIHGRRMIRAVFPPGV